MHTNRTTGLRALLIGTVALWATVAAAGAAAPPAIPPLQDYAKPGELAPLAPGQASLYRTPWRANVRTVSARQALDGIGVYYKHIPGDWSVAEHTNVMRQMAECGVRRLRLAPHHTMYIHADWEGPSQKELDGMRKEFTACKAAGIRPCVVFVHIPPMGEGDALQKWFKRDWNKGLLPAGPKGSAEYALFLDKVYIGLQAILDVARQAGFAEPDSYDLEIGQNLWWGFPALPPFPGLTLEMIRPGGQVYEFDMDLIRRARAAGYREPTLWWGQTHHLFDECRDTDVPDLCVGRAASFYHPGSGTAGVDWLEKTADDWPSRATLNFAEGQPPEMLLTKPEGWFADRSRRDNLIALIRDSRTPVAVTSLGTVPNSIPGAGNGGLSGWQIKERTVPRSLAFWLNQGAASVLVHSAYEGGQRDGGAGQHSLIPSPVDPAVFSWQDALPLVALKAFSDGLDGAEPIAKPDALSFRYALSPDPVLIPASPHGEALRASDAVALFSFQIAATEFAVAAYVVSPDITRLLPAMTMTLEVDRLLPQRGTTVYRIFGRQGTHVDILQRDPETGRTVIRFPVHDDVSWLRFALAPASP